MQKTLKIPPKQLEQINEFKIKLETLLCSEKMEFIGFITSKFIYSNNTEKKFF